MSALHVTLKNTQGMAVGKDRIERFQASFRGEVIQPADFAYEKARKIRNASIDKHPGIIARCAGIADVMAAVNFARPWRSHRCKRYWTGLSQTVTITTGNRPSCASSAMMRSPCLWSMRTGRRLLLREWLSSTMAELRVGLESPTLLLRSVKPPLTWISQIGSWTERRYDKRV